jgi:hypothetical protein
MIKNSFLSMKFKYLFLAGLLVLQLQVSAQEISSKRLKKHIEYLASDSLKGRYPGTAEHLLAAQYIRDSFKKSGLTLLGNNGLQSFSLVTGVKLADGNSLKVDGKSLELGKDFNPMGLTGNGAVSGDVVFVGYGFQIKNDSIAWNDYLNVDVKGKWVLVIRLDPELDNPKSALAEFGQDRFKVRSAIDNGAIGVLMVNSTEFDKEDGVEKLRYDQSQSRSAIPVISVTRAVADQILASQGKTFTEMEKALKTNHQPVSFATSVKIDGVTAVDAQVVETQNIVGYIKGSENPDQFVVVGAHFDHLGFGGSGTGSRKPDTVAVHNGADDNASGTALVMELARALAKSKPDKSILFMAFTAEEMGLIGSKYFTAHPLVDKSKIVAMVNMDMVGRLNDNKELMVGGTGTAKEADSLLTVAAAKYPFHIKRDPQGTGPSDHSAFYVENIPVLYFTSGLHDQYHTPEDDANLINYEGEATIGNLVGDMVKTYASAAKLTFQQAGVPQESNYRRRLKATLGVVPDHTADVKGFRIDGTRAGGPAATAGLQKGDVIVAIDGMEITNIYDYMYRLAKYSKGDRITVELIRDGEKKIFLIIL